MNDLDVKQKVKLFKKLYEELSGYGINGDTELAHVNKYEAAVLKAMGGSGTLNSITGLRQYSFLFGDDDEPAPAPASTTVTQVSDLPEYIKPYVEKLLATTEKVYDQPYVPYTGQRLAEPSAAQQSALSGIVETFTGPDGKFMMPGASSFEQAGQLAQQAAKQFGDVSPVEFQQKYMSPYQQAVTDIQKREFEKEATRREQQRATLAGQARAFGGSRDVLERMLGKEATQRGLSDIEATGLQSAYEQGLKQFEADRAAARSGATQLSQLSAQEQAQTLTGLGALQTVGETQRALEQQPLDIAYEEFARQQTYPKQALQELSGIIRGYAQKPDIYGTTQQFQQPPSLGQQLLSAGTVAAGISSGLGKSFFGTPSAAQGGLVGLAKGGMVKKYKNGGYPLSDAQLELFSQFGIEPDDSIEDLSEVTPYKTDNPYSGFAKPKGKDIPQIQESIDETFVLPPEVSGEGDIIQPTYFDKLKEYKRIANLPITVEGGFNDDLNIADIADLPLSSDISKPEEKGGKPEQDDKKEKPFFNLEAALPYFQAAAQFIRPGQDTATAALAGLKEFAGAKAKMREAETEEEKLELKRQQVAGLNKYYQGQTAAAIAKANRDAMTLGRDTLLEQMKALKPILETASEQISKAAPGTDTSKAQAIYDQQLIYYQALVNAYQKNFGTLPTFEFKKKPEE